MLAQWLRLFINSLIASRIARYANLFEFFLLYMNGTPIDVCASLLDKEN